MRLIDPQLDALRKKRLQAASDLEQVSKRLLGHASRIRLYDDAEADAEWPVDWPIPTDVAKAIQAACDAAQAVDVATTEAKRAYRKRVLEWLLAETDHQASRR